MRPVYTPHAPYSPLSPPDARSTFGTLGSRSPPLSPSGMSPPERISRARRRRTLALTTSFDDLISGSVALRPQYKLWDRDAEVCLLFVILFTTFVLTAITVLVPFDDPAVQDLPNVRDARLWMALYADRAKRERGEELRRLFEGMLSSQVSF